MKSALCIVAAVVLLTTAVVGKHTEKVPSAERAEKEALQREAAEALKVPPTGFCEQLGTCAECVFDSSLGLMSDYHNCSWCPTTEKCLPATANISSICPAAQYRGEDRHPQCREMRCVAASEWTNVYFCRPGMRAALAVSVLLLFLSVVFYVLYYRMIVQKPWRYSSIHRVVDDHVNAGSSGFLKELRDDQRELPEGDDSYSDSNESTDEEVPSVIKCQICKVLSPSVQSGDQVCFWCNVARLAFLPLMLGSVVSVLGIFLIFFVGLKPWFATYYYFILFSIGYLGYFIFFFIVHNNRVAVVGDEEARLSSFVHLGVVLHGRKLKAVFPNLREPIDEELPLPKIDVTTATPQVPHDDASSVASTAPKPASPGMNSLQANAVAPPAKDYPTTRQASAINSLIREVIPPESPEEILWSYQPEPADIFADNVWIFFFFGSLTLIGLWMCLAAMAGGEWSIFNIASSTLLTPIGVAFVFVGLFVLFHMRNGLVRMYVMTGKRLIVFTQNDTSAIASDTQIEFVACASFQTYTCFTVSRFASVVRSFSWTAPEEGRKLPPITSTAFVGLSTEALVDLREKFDSCVKLTINSDAIKTDFAHLRVSWKMLIGLNLLCLAILPIFLFQSYFVPPSIAVFGLIAFGSLPLTMIYRGYRVHKLSVISHNVKKEELSFRRNTKGFTLREVAKVAIALKRMASPSKRKTGGSQSPARRPSNEAQQMAHLAAATAAASSTPPEAQARSEED